MSHYAPVSARDRGRKRKSIIAGGVVLGLGAAATLAAWSDDIWVSASFSTGKFNVQAAVDHSGNDWEEYNGSSNPSVGNVRFTIADTGMSPGEPVFAPLGLRVSAGDLDARITLTETPARPTQAGRNQDFFDALRLTAYSNVHPANCLAGDTSAGAIVGQIENVPLNAGQGTQLGFLPKNHAAVRICFRLVLPVGTKSNVASAELSAPSWLLTAESVPPPEP